MGFNAGKKKPSSSSGGVQLELKFQPSTKAEIKEFARRAAAHDEARREAKQNRSAGKKMKLDADMNLDFKILKPKALRRTVKEIVANRAKLWLANKKNDKRWVPRFPRYEAFEKPKLADSNFVFDVQSLLANFSWKELSELINAAAGEEIQTKTYSEAFHTAQAVMHQALGIEIDSTGARYRLKDRETTLEEWEIEVVERKLKMSKKPIGDDEDDVKKKVKARAADADEGEEADDEEEESAEEEESDDEEEDEKPAKKKKVAAKSKKKKSADAESDEDEEQEDSEDDDGDADDEEESDDEDEDEKPVKKKKPAKKKAAKDDDDEEEEESEDDEDDEEEEDDSDEDEDGDDQPKAKRKGKKAVASKSKEKVKEKSAKAAKKPAAAARARRNADAVYKVKKKFAGGVREQCQSVIPAKGATVEAIGAAMKKKFSVDPKKARNYVSWLTANGYLTVSE